MTEHKITQDMMEEDGPGRWRSAHFGPSLTMTVDGSSTRFALGYHDATAEPCRRVAYGPLEPTPYAFAYGKATVIDNHGGSGAEHERNLQAKLVIQAEVGDVLEFWDGSRWAVTWAGSVYQFDFHNVRLLQLTDELELVAAAYLATYAYWNEHGGVSPSIDDACREMAEVLGVDKPDGDAVARLYEFESSGRTEYEVAARFIKEARR